MGEEVRRTEKCILDVPYGVLLTICRSLDADEGWEKLAAQAGFSFEQIRLLELEKARSQGSPTRHLLWLLGNRNVTVRQLYKYLSELGRLRELKVLEDYVHGPPGHSGGEGPAMRDTANSPVPGLKGLTPPGHCPATTSTPSSSNRNQIDGRQIACGHSYQPPSNLPNNSIKGKSVKNDLHDHVQGMLLNINSNIPVSVVTTAIQNEDVSQHSTIQAPATSCKGVSMPGGLVHLKPNKPKSNHSVANTDPSSVLKPSSLNPSYTSDVCRTSEAFSDLPQSWEASTGTQSPLVDTNRDCLSKPNPSPPSILSGVVGHVDLQVGVLGTARFSYEEIARATNNFSVESKLGEGMFGIVYRGVLRQQSCAVKKVIETSTQETAEERAAHVQKEIAFLSKFRHENIVTLYGYALEKTSLCLVYQFMSNGSLADRLLCKFGTSPLLWSQRLNILQGACQGLHFLHAMGEKPLIHGDIKSTNILLDKHMEAKLSDLGQAQQVMEQQVARNNNNNSTCTTSGRMHITRAEASTKQYGTRAYLPAEVQTGGPPTEKSDIYAMGVVALEVFSGEQAYDEDRERDKFLGLYFQNLRDESGEEACLSRMDRHGGECPKDVGLAILNFTAKCTSPRKRHRPNSAQLLEAVKDARKLYKQKTGIKDITHSFDASEHSCNALHSYLPDSSEERQLKDTQLSDFQSPPTLERVTSPGNSSANQTRECLPSESYHFTNIHELDPVLKAGAATGHSKDRDQKQLNTDQAAVQTMTPDSDKPANSIKTDFPSPESSTAKQTLFAGHTVHAEESVGPSDEKNSSVRDEISSDQLDPVVTLQRDILTACYYKSKQQQTNIQKQQLPSSHAPHLAEPQFYSIPVPETCGQDSSQLLTNASVSKSVTGSDEAAAKLLQHRETFLAQYQKALAEVNTADDDRNETGAEGITEDTKATVSDNTVNNDMKSFQVTAPCPNEEPENSSAPVCEQLLFRKKDFFNQYKRAVEETEDVEPEDVQGTDDDEKSTEDTVLSGSDKK